ncbi:MAG: Protein-tyrosine-phosphatase [Firmicutes bacterium]|nr:Protein-tyrosine-phosphatase [Bacillota bacterium]
MKRILFVCHGNICRSPMAEFVMKNLVDRHDRGGEFSIDSAGTSREEVGNPVYPPAARELRLNGLEPGSKTARQLRPEDYQEYDVLVGMDEANVQNMLRLYHGDPDNKIVRLLNLTQKPRDIADPWYSGDFTQTWRDVNQGCVALLNWLDR